MLTSDLVLTRVYRGEVRPRYVDVDDADLLGLAEQLLEIFAESVGRPRFELDQELKDLVGTGTDFLLHRGLAKLLLDRCEFETSGEVEPQDLRRDVFRASAAAYRAEPDSPHLHFDRANLLGAVAEARALSPAELERGLYADLKDEQELTSWRKMEPRALLARYNVALAQSVLLRATELEIRVGKETPRRHRALFGRIKFFQLLHRVEREGKGWRIHLDGPLSLFQSVGKYGVQMGSFLPTLLHLKDWELEAKLLWGKKRVPRTFSLSPKQGLEPLGRLTGQWQPDELAMLADQFAQLDTDWTLSTDAELVDLGEGVLVPDFVFEHPRGARVVMEVLGFWRKGAVESRLAQLRKRGPKNLILAISKQLAAGQGDLGELPGEVYVFRAMPIAREILKRLESFP